MQRFLCWDSKNIATAENISVLQHKPEKKNIALVCDDIWEGVHNGYPTVMKVGDTYRMYYRALGQRGGILEKYDNPTRGVFCVAESTDGITFHKKNIGRFEYQGSKDNNVVFWSEEYKVTDTLTVFYDDNPACPENEKFKALARYSGTAILDLFISADGYEFTFVQGLDVNGTFDSYNTVFFNKETGLYNLYFRGFHHPDGSSTKGFADANETSDIRDIRLAVSKDFRNWDFVGFVQLNSKKQIQPYTNQISQYYRDPKTFIGFPTRYYDRVKEQDSYWTMPNGEKRREFIKTQGRGGTALTDCGIMTSTDGLSFDLRPSAFLTPGPEHSCNWWYGDGYISYGWVETLAEDGENKEISFYTGENYRVKRVNFRRYTIRLDGFFSWYGDGNGAEVITKPFVLENSRMFVNLAASALGGLKITLLDKEGKALPGYTSHLLFGDSTNRPVTFEKDLQALVGQTIQIRFQLDDCHLYSYTFE